MGGSGANCGRTKRSDVRMRHDREMTFWVPTTEADIRSVIESGDATENHYLDFKREFGDSPSSRKEAARDLASFAVHGGVLVIGVDEPEPGHFELAPIPLENASERVEQIAANRPDPGIYVRTTTIPSDTNPALGYLVVEVPPSPGAPHMVDGRYWGRSERTKRQLGDAEVVQLHSTRRSTEARVWAAIAEEIERDPAPQPAARMFLVAEPIQAPAGLARSYVRGNPREMLNLSGVAEGELPQSVAQSSPTPHDLSTTVRRAKGLARTNLSDGRTVPTMFEAEYATDIEVQISGSIRVMVSQIAYTSRVERVQGEAPFLVEGLPVAWSHRMARYAAGLSRILDYQGPWGIGIHIYGLAGARAGGEERWGAYRLPVYDGSTYEAVVVASLNEIEVAPGMVVDRLVGDLIHALGVSDRYADALAQ